MDLGLYAPRLARLGPPTIDGNDGSTNG